MAQAVAEAPVRRAPFPVELYRSAVGKKYVMAITGVMWMGFVLFHMAGNLKMYLGAAHLNEYGEWLRNLLVPFLPRTLFLWMFLRAAIFLAFVLHIHAAYSLTRLNRAANTPYESRRDYVAANFASRTMRWTGVIVLLFLAWHLADFTWGIHAVNPDFHRGDIYGNVVHSFERPVVAVFYIVANLALGVHLLHGAWSLFQSLGANNPRFNAWRRWFAYGFTILVIGGNVSFPLAVMTGVVG